METERKIPVARSLFYKKKGTFCDPYHSSGNKTPSVRVITASNSCSFSISPIVQRTEDSQRQRCVNCAQLIVFMCKSTCRSGWNRVTVHTCAGENQTVLILFRSNADRPVSLRISVYHTNNKQPLDVTIVCLYTRQKNIFLNEQKIGMLL